jgi:hypothetical protein
MVEGPTQKVTEKYCQQIADVIKNTLGKGRKKNI